MTHLLCFSFLAFLSFFSRRPGSVSGAARFNKQFVSAFGHVNRRAALRKKSFTRRPGIDSLPVLEYQWF
jgi:hypothetical protein